MDKKYDPTKIEAKWQKIWAEENIYLTPEKPVNKKYVLDMFPYPSGAGLHVGHMEGYVATDVVSRFLRMKGFSVLHPMGWDAFGLPAENYAIKTGTPPDATTHENINNFRKQLKMLGLSYDWSREIDTSDSDYYKWTQWLFIELFNKGLAYKKKAPANFCPKDETVLANEQVVDGKCERCGTEVVQKELDQWFFKITDYADKLIAGLDKIDWPESTKQQQINWIGRKEGVIVKFSIFNSQFSIKEIEIFTTRPDTIFGATFLVLSPDHPIAKKLNIQVKMDEKVKNGLDTGLKVVNPANGEKIPVWVSNYVLSETGTGAIMAVPFFDLRDSEFAEKFKLEIKKIELDEGILEKLVDRGIARKVVNYHLRDWLISRQRYWGCPIPMIYCEKDGWQPVPETDLPILLPTDVDFFPHGESPIARSKSFQQGAKCPVCDGLARREVDTMDTYVDSSWYFYAFILAEKLNEAQKGHLRHFRNVFKECEEELSHWIPVDIYIGGGHVVQHLLFARFFHKVLVDLAYLKDDGINEPFLTLRAPGWILGPDSRKMSKRWGNIITPEEVVAKHGADTMRVYEMFMAPFEVDKPWNVNSVAGVQRFLGRIYDLFEKFYQIKDQSASDEAVRGINKLIFKVGKDIEEFKFNTAIAAMMEFVNLMSNVAGPAGLHPAPTSSAAKAEPAGARAGSPRPSPAFENWYWNDIWEKFLIVLGPFAPHLAEELYQMLIAGPVTSAILKVLPAKSLATSSSNPAGLRSGRLRRGSLVALKGSSSVPPAFESIQQQKWPEVEEKFLAEDSVTIVVALNGKARGVLEIENGKMRDEKEIVKLAKSELKIAKYLEGKEIKKTIYVPGKILNFVI